MPKTLLDQVLVEVIKEKKTKGGIILPDTAKKEYEEGKVVAVGPGRLSGGKYVPSIVKKGDRILFSSDYDAKKIQIDGKNYLVIKEDNILAVLD